MNKLGLTPQSLTALNYKDSIQSYNIKERAEGLSLWKALLSFVVASEWERCNLRGEEILSHQTVSVQFHLMSPSKASYRVQGVGRFPSSGMGMGLGQPLKFLKNRSFKSLHLGIRFFIARTKKSCTSKDWVFWGAFGSDLSLREMGGSHYVKSKSKRERKRRLSFPRWVEGFWLLLFNLFSLFVDSLGTLQTLFAALLCSPL